MAPHLDEKLLNVITNVKIMFLCIDSCCHNNLENFDQKVTINLFQAKKTCKAHCSTQNENKFQNKNRSKEKIW